MEEVSMLVLSRKLGEKIVAGDVTIEVVRIEGGKVRIGITAPEGVRVLRAELLDRQPRDTQAA